MSADRADLVIVNTCSVTASADQGARQTIRRIARDNPAARIVATGCYATRCADEVAALPGVAAVVPNDERRWLLRAPPGIGAEPRRPVRPAARARPDGPHRVDAARADGLRGAVQLLHHPDYRGASRSRAVGDVLERRAGSSTRATRRSSSPACISARDGRDLPPDPPARFAHVAGTPYRAASCSVSARWSRWTAQPGVIGWLVDLGLNVKAPHLHLPLQHAADSLLLGDASNLLGCCFCPLAHGKLPRARLPHTAIGSDVIVGFPAGETHSGRRDPGRATSQLAAHATPRVPVLRPPRDRRRGLAARSTVRW